MYDHLFITCMFCVLTAASSIVTSTPEKQCSTNLLDEGDEDSSLCDQMLKTPPPLPPPLQYTLSPSDSADQGLLYA